MQNLSSELCNQVNGGYLEVGSSFPNYIFEVRWVIHYIG